MSTKTTAMCLASAALLLAGCAGYQWGSTTHPYLKSLSVAPVVNRTEEAQVEKTLRMRLNESLYQTTGIHPDDLGDGRAVLKAEIASVKQSVAGSLASRTDARSKEYGNVSTTTLYAVQVTVD